MFTESQRTVARRGVLLSFLLGLSGIGTLATFWALYYWPILEAFILFYLAFASYNFFNYSGSLFTLSQAHQLVGSREQLGATISIAGVVAMLGAVGEVVHGVIVAGTASSGLYLVFGALAAMVGII